MFAIFTPVTLPATLASRSDGVMPAWRTLVLVEEDQQMATERRAEAVRRRSITISPARGSVVVLRDQPAHEAPPVGLSPAAAAA
jgi:hypothetical protein